MNLLSNVFGTIFSPTNTCSRLLWPSHDLYFPNYCNHRLSISFLCVWFCDWYLLWFSKKIENKNTNIVLLHWGTYTNIGRVLYIQYYPWWKNKCALKLSQIITGHSWWFKNTHKIMQALDEPVLQSEFN